MADADNDQAPDDERHAQDLLKKRKVEQERLEDEAYSAAVARLRRRTPTDIESIEKGAKIYGSLSGITYKRALAKTLMEVEADEARWKRSDDRYAEAKQ
jgi:hypothetical protein